MYFGKIALFLGFVFNSVYDPEINQRELVQRLYEEEQLENKEILSGFIKNNKNQNIKIAFRKDLWTHFEYPLVIAAQNGWLNELTMLLEQGADPNSDNVLYEAIVHKCYECAGKLLEYGADPNSKAVNENPSKLPLVELINNYVLAWNNYSYPFIGNFITRLFQYKNPYTRFNYGKNDIELIENRINHCENKEQEEYLHSVLQKLKTIRLNPKSLKELSIRIVISHNFHTACKTSLPIELNEEINRYAQRKDMIYIVKKWQ